MTAIQYDFNVHDLVRFRVGGLPFLLAPVIHEFAHYRDKNPHEPDLLVTLDYAAGPEAPEIVKSLEAESGSLFSWEGEHLKAKWRAWITDLDSAPVKLYFAGNTFSRFIVSKWIVEPALRIVARRKGLVMVHAASLSDGNDALLVAGPGGSGKTTWALRWLSAGHPYMGDDFSILTHDMVLSYVTPLRIGLRNLMTNKILKDMQLVDKLEIAARTVARQASLGKLKVYKKSAINRAAPGVAVAKKAKLKGVVWIEERPPKEAARAPMDPEKISGLLADMNQEEMHGFGQSESAGLLDESWWEQHRKMLLEAVSGKPCFCARAHDLPPASAIASIPALIDWLHEAEHSKSRI